MDKRRGAGAVALVAGLALLAAGYWLTALLVPTSYYVADSGSYIPGDWRVVPPGGSEPGNRFGGFALPASSEVTAKATFDSAANGTLWLEVEAYPQRTTLLVLEAPRYLAALDGSGGRGISYGGGNTSVYSDFVLQNGTEYLVLSIDNNGSAPVNSTYASWSVSLPVFAHPYLAYGWGGIVAGATAAVAGMVLLVRPGGKGGGKGSVQETPFQVEAEA